MPMLLEPLIGKVKAPPRPKTNLNIVNTKKAGTEVTPPQTPPDTGMRLKE